MFLTGGEVRGIGELTRIGGLGGGDVAKSEWGNKCVCQSCGTKFYDLKKSSVRCPSCNEPYDGKPAKSAEVKRAKLSGVKRAKPAAPAPAKAELPAKEEPPPPSMDDDDIEAGSKKDVDDADLAKDIESDEADDEEEEPIEDAAELGGAQDEVAEVIDVKVEKVAGER